MESILLSIKKKLGPVQEYNYFDEDIIIEINSAIMALNQIGVGVDGFMVTGEGETWTDFLGDKYTKMPAVITYIYIKCRLVFDPPTSSFVLKALEDQAKEYEFRLNINAETE